MRVWGGKRGGAAACTGRAVSEDRRVLAALEDAVDQPARRARVHLLINRTAAVHGVEPELGGLDVRRQVHLHLGLVHRYVRRGQSVRAGALHLNNVVLLIGQLLLVQRPLPHDNADARLALVGGARARHLLSLL